MALSTVPPGAVTQKLAVGGSNIVTVGDDPELQQIAPNHKAGIAAGPKGGDLLVAV